MKTIASNRRAAFDYDFLEKIEAGIELFGFEAKSVFNGRVNITGAYVHIQGEEAWLLNAEIPPHQPKNAPVDYDPRRPRRLLLKKREIKYLTGKAKEKKVSLIPLKIYEKKGIIKLEIGVGKARKKVDKRDLIKKREIEREIRRFVKNE